MLTLASRGQSKQGISSIGAISRNGRFSARQVDGPIPVPVIVPTVFFSGAATEEVEAGQGQRVAVEAMPERTEIGEWHGHAMGAQRGNGRGNAHNGA